MLHTQKAIIAFLKRNTLKMPVLLQYKVKKALAEIHILSTFISTIDITELSCSY